jgi:hypothetical protein
VQHRAEDAVSREAAQALAASARALSMRGDFLGAIADLRRALDLAPSHHLRARLVAALVDVGALDEAHDEALDGVQLAPRSPMAFETLARALLARLDDAGASEAFQVCAALRASAPLGSDKIILPVHAILHTLDQMAYLGAIPDLVQRHEFDIVPFARLRAQLLTIAKESAGAPAFVSVSGADAERLLRPPLIAPDLPAIEQPLRADAPWSEFDAELDSGNKDFAMIDQFLTLPALAALQHYCLAATVWRRPYKFGYIGAFPEDGFTPNLLFTIAHDLKRRLPRTLGEMRLDQWWAFSYDPHLPGTDIHGDDSDISLNIWITPNSANLDPHGCGLEIWDAMAPKEWSFDEYNSGGERVRAYLDSVQAQSIVIPYMENRALVFRGRLFHRSRDASFRDDYINRRRNITLLFRRPKARTRHSG